VPSGHGKSTTTSIFSRNCLCSFVYSLHSHLNSWRGGTGQPCPQYRVTTPCLAILLSGRYCLPRLSPPAEAQEHFAILPEDTVKPAPSLSYHRPEPADDINCYRAVCRRTDRRCFFLAHCLHVILLPHAFVCRGFSLPPFLRSSVPLHCVTV